MVRVLAGEVARGAGRRGPCRPAFERTGGSAPTPSEIGSARHVDCGPASFSKQAARRGVSPGVWDAVDVVVLRIGVEQKKPFLPDLHNPFGGSNEPDNERAAKMVNSVWQWETRHNWEVGSLVSTIGEINAGRCLRSAANSQ